VVLSLKVGSCTSHYYHAKRVTNTLAYFGRSINGEEAK
jgi:hypothetical protein